jgi:hypothetical protein
MSHQELNQALANYRRDLAYELIAQHKAVA